MPRFIPHGPIVPDRLAQELEADRVVIFCGAGISIGSGLPSYAGLVRHCYGEFGLPTPTNTSPEWHWPDRMLGVLESKKTPRDVRRAVATRLLQEPTSLDIHRALIRLARLRRSPGLRLVTTNYDHLFEKAQDNLRLGHDFHSAPILPIPRNDRAATWRSIVYLHGRLEPPDGDNSHLVLTSADFGRAYLIDGWAARFVARLFADFTVLFVGYSLNDPVLRYMIDAFAAEEARARGGITRGPAYIFVAHQAAPPDRQPYLDRKLEPIFYNQMYHHVRLKKTLIEWARAREDYLSKVGVMINRIARNPPEALDPSATDNLLWAVLGRPDDLGYGAKTFAKLDPLPRLQWLEAFERRETEMRAVHAADVAAAKEAERVPPPEPVYHIERLFPLQREEHSRQPTNTGLALIPWVVGHLKSVDLVDWTIAKMREGRRPHAVLRARIRQRLLEDPPLPDGFQRFWRIVSSEGGWAFGLPAAPDLLFGLARSLRVPRDESWAREELKAVLRPYLVLDRSRYRRWRSEMNLEEGAEVEGRTLDEIATGKVVLAGEQILGELIRAIDGTAGADAFWLARLDILTATLLQVFELFAVAGQANREMDPSAVERPSILPHHQNRLNDTWSRLYDLIWRGWAHLDVTNPEASRSQILTWQRIPFLGFQRLVLAAVRHSPHFTADEKLEFLLNG